MNLNIGIDMGHTISGADYGAVGILKESVCTREIGYYVKRYLKDLGHTVYDLTVDYANSINESLNIRVKNANSVKLDLIISIHLNSGGGTGVETFIPARGGNSEKFAKRVQSELVKLGYKDRGVKVAKESLGYSLAMLSNTDAPSILVECGFVDSSIDSGIYNPSNIAKAIVEGATGQILDNKKYYVVTNYLPNGYRGDETFAGIDLDYVLSYFENIRCYMKSNDKGMWIETQFLPYDKCVELKQTLGSWFWSIEEVE